MEIDVPLWNIVLMTGTITYAGFLEYNKSSRVVVLLHTISAFINGTVAILLSKGILPL